MLVFTIVLGDCLQHGFRSIHFMNRPPPLPANGGRDKCEFDDVPCNSKGSFEIPCCGTRRCVEHSKPEYVCSCFIALTGMSRKPRQPERRVKPKDVMLSRCGVPLRPPNRSVLPVEWVLLFAGIEVNVASTPGWRNRKRDG